MARDKTVTQSKVYWASEEDVNKLSGYLQDKIYDYYNYVQTVGLFDKWLKAYACYYTNLINSASITRTGPQGQFLTISVAEARSILQRLLTLTISERPTWEPQTINSDAINQRQTITARGLLDYYMVTKRVEKDIYQAVEYSLIFGAGYVSVNWDGALGEVYAFDQDTGAPTNKGDLKYRSHEPIDVIYDIGLNAYRDRDWLIVREYDNKHNLMAKYPEFADKIKATDGMLPYDHHYRVKKMMPWDTDIIPFYKFYHSRSAALNEGRYVEFLPDGTVMVDTLGTEPGFPYKHIPVYRVTPSDVVGSAFGYAPMYDLLPLQQDFDIVMSSIITTNEAFGVPNILCPLGSNIEFSQMTGGLKFIEYLRTAEGGKPEAMQMPEPPQSLYTSINLIEKKMQDVTNINAVTRGNLPSADLSGAALALLQSMAIQANSNTQLSYTQLLEDVGTATVQILKEYAEIPRIIAITGKYNRSDSLDFSKDKISGIDRVLVKAGNPLTKTTSGKVTIAQMLLEAKVIKTSDELLQVIETGSLDPMIQGKRRELLGLQSRCEALLDGKKIKVLVTDDHTLCMQEYKALLADDKARDDEEIINNVMDALLQSVKFLTDPEYKNLLMILGQPVNELQPEQATQAQAQAAGNTAGQLEQPGADVNGQIQDMQPNQPNLPNNPMTGQPNQG